MFRIPVYRAERDAGLEQGILSSARIAYASAVLPNRPALAEGALARARAAAALLSASGGLDDFDLYPLTTVLVTTGWNKNDDVFDGVETWVARRTPEDKQLNYEHDDSRIVGHIVSNVAVRDGEGGAAVGEAIPDDAVVDELPPKFHLVTGAVLYKHWQTPELQKRMDDLLAGIAKGEWFVSMECLFRGFDYALKSSDGSAKIVARNEKTAFLSKHLRCYGGTGQYGEYRVGRLLRNIVFSGKGLVKNPANPESVILAAACDPFAASAAELVTDFSPLCAERVYSPATPEEIANKPESPQVMTVTVEQLQAQLADLRAENEKLKASQAETLVAELRAKLEAAEASLLKANEAARTASDGAGSAKADADAMRAKLEEAEKSLAEARDELKGLYAEKTAAARLAAAKDKLKLPDEAAAKFVESTSAQSDEAFAAQVEVMAAAMTAWVTNNPQPGNTAFDGGASPKPAPKSTDKPTAPKATSKPAPMAGRAAEEDAAGEAAAEEADLDNPEAAAGAALAAGVSDASVNEVGRAVAAMFGYVADDQAAD